MNERQEEQSWNPEPPAEILNIENEEMIEGTLYSKHWVFELLLKLIKKSSEIGADSELSELEEGFEKELCDLWDMSINVNVCTFLDEHECLQIFEGLLGSKFATVYPRAVEILVGILVNMVTLSEHIRLNILTDSNSALLSFILIEIFATQTDVQSMIQALRLLNIILSDVDSEAKLNANKRLVEQMKNSDMEIIVKKIAFVFEFSLNKSLLDTTCTFLNNLLDNDDLIQVVLFQDARLVETLCNASLTRLDAESESSTVDECDKTAEAAHDLEQANKLLDNYFACLYAASTCQLGVIRLNESFDLIMKLFDKYLNVLCTSLRDSDVKSDRILAECILNSSMQNCSYLIAVLNVLLSDKQPLDEICSKHEFMFENLLELSMLYLKMCLNVDDLKSADCNLNHRSLKLVENNIKELLGLISVPNGFEQAKSLTSLGENCLKLFK